MSVKKFDWEEKHSIIFDEIKQAVANIAKINFYNPARETQVKCYASHSGLGATLEEKTREGEWMPISFASRYLKTQEKKYSTNELEFLAVVWSVDRFKHYLLGREFTIATNHKALTSALGENCANKTYQSRLLRWVDRLLPYQFKIVHIPGTDMGIVDCLSREPNGDPWPVFEIDKKFVVTSIENFHKARYCWNSRLSNTTESSNSVKVLEHSEGNTGSNAKANTSSHSCYSNQIGSKRTGLDRNENGQSPRLENSKTNTLHNFSHQTQLAKISTVNSIKNSMRKKQDAGRKFG